MKIKMLVIGKTDSPALEELIEEYGKRLTRHITFELEIIPDVKRNKNLSESEQKSKEGQLILSRLNPTDMVIVLDERGREYSSVDFAKYLQKLMNSGIKQMIFIIGGPYGISPDVMQRAQASWSLSRLTFSHQMVRLFAVEQLYRAFSILKNLPYHHH